MNLIKAQSSCNQPWSPEAKLPDFNPHVADELELGNSQYASELVVIMGLALVGSGSRCPRRVRRSNVVGPDGPRDPQRDVANPEVSGVKVIDPEVSLETKTLSVGCQK
jgi:hypothetical protein